MSEVALQPGQVVAGWTLIELLQASPHVSTWKATAGAHPGVLKVFSAPLDAAARRSLQRAFRRSRGLRVDGVVAPLLLENTDHGMVIARPLVDGRPLFDAIREHRGPEQVSHATQLAAGLFRVLAALHREGLIHGQLGPGNVWVTATGAVVLTDFGSSEADVRTTSADSPGRLPPTAPEVATGWGLRPASDVHAAGALLYAALAPPTADLTDRTTPWGIGAAEALPGLALRRPDISSRLSHLLEQTQALDWALRPTAAQLAQVLDAPDALDQPAPLPASPLRVGQTAPLQAAEQHLGRPGPRLVLLSGPAGCGRHRLADALARHQLRGHRPTLHISADRTETGSLLVGTLRRIVGQDQHAARRKRLLRDLGAPLAALWPELGGEGLKSPENTDARAIIDAAVGVVHRALADRPACFLFDRLEDADPLGLRFVHTLLDTERDVRAIAIVDDRWQTDELRRMRSRLSERAAVLEITLPDLTPAESRRVLELLTRGIPDAKRPDITAPASPARVTEHAHRLLAAWRDEPHHAPDAAATLFAIAERVPSAALHTLGLDPATAIAHHVAVVDQPGQLRRRHAGVQAFGSRGLSRRDKLADRLADALEAIPVSADQLARVRLLGTDLPRTACARAAIAAHADDRPDQTRRWLHVVDRLSRDPNDSAYRSVRAPIARIRAEVAHETAGAPLRPDLLHQAIRRARTPDEQAALARVLGLVARGEGNLPAAERAWLAGAEDPDAHPTHQARCALHALELAHHAGALDRAEVALRALNRATRAPDQPRGPRRWLALGTARHALATGEPRHAVRILQDWCSEAGPDPEASHTLARALHAVGDDDAAQQQVNALLDARPHHAPARLLHGWLAILRGDTRAAIRAHRALPTTSTDPLHLAFALRLAAAQGERHHLPDLLGRPAPSRRPDLLGTWMAAVLDALRTLDEPGIRLARLDAAAKMAASVPCPALQLALAWHHIDDDNLDAARDLAARAGTLADRHAHPVHALRARMLHAATSPPRANAWQALIEAGSNHPDTRVRHDLGELSARLALRTGDPAVADQWVRFLSNLAVHAPDHALAARATRVHKRVQASMRRANDL